MVYQLVDHSVRAVYGIKCIRTAQTLESWVRILLEETASSFPQYALYHSVTCVQHRLITILGNCGCVVVASFLGNVTGNGNFQEMLSVRAGTPGTEPSSAN
jgi:hypothetical protein